MLAFPDGTVMKHKVQWLDAKSVVSCSIVPRRLFIVLLAAAQVIPAQGPAPYDVLIKNGRVLDGSGNPWARLDVGVRSGRIAFLGDSRSFGISAKDTVDAQGMYVSPGFIDLHSHLELRTAPVRAALAFLYQGITTAITGNDGGGNWRIDDEARDIHRSGMAVNIGFLVGHSAVRREVIGMQNRVPATAEIQQMRALVRAAMRQGAFGLSSDLFDAPGNWASTAEVIELAREAADSGGYYDTHMRDEGVAVPEFGFLNSIREALEIGASSGIPVHISHIHPLGVAAHGLSREAVGLIEASRNQGIEVTADQYPYDASMNSLAAVALPRWAEEGNPEAVRRRLNDSNVRPQLMSEIAAMIQRRGGPDSIVVAQSGAELNTAGRSLTFLAHDWNTTPAEVVRRILAQFNPLVVSHNQSQEDIELFVRQEWVATCTDGFIPLFGEGVPHPRSYGAFPRKLRQFALNRDLISLPFAIRSMTSLPAAILRLPDRGLVRQGYFADLVVFDPGTITDRATFDQPHQYAEGIIDVLVNGRFAIRNSKPEGAWFGKVLRRTDRPDQ